MNTILLNNKKYKVRSQLLRQPQTPWLARVGQNEPRYADLQPASHWVMTHWGGGYGKFESDIFEDTASFFDSELWTHFKGQLMIPGKRVTISGTYGFRPNNARIDFRGTVYQGGDAGTGVRPLWTLGDGPTWTAVTATGAPGTGLECWDMCVQQRYLYCAFSGEANIFRFDGTTWTDLGFAADRVVDFRDDIVIAATYDNTNKEISINWSDDDGTTWTELLRVYSSAHVRKLVKSLDARGFDVIRLGTAEGLWVIDFDAQQATLLHDMSSHIGEANCRDMIGDPYVPVDNAGLLEIYPDHRVVDDGFDRDDGLPSGKMAAINTLCRTNHWLYAGTAANFEDGTARAATTTAGVYVMNPETRTWHYIAKASTTAKDIFSIIYSNRADDKYRLYFWESAYGSTSATPYYIDMPDVNDNPALAPADVNSEASGNLITPWFNGGFFNIKKALLSVSGEAKNLSATHTVQVQYAIDDSSSYTNWVTYTSGPQLTASLLTSGSAPAELLGVVFKNARLKITLANTDETPTVGAGPILRHLVADYISVPSALYFWRVRIYLKDLEPGFGLTELHAALLTAYEGQQAVAFYERADQRETRHFVKISSIVFNELCQEADMEAAVVDMVVSEIAK